MDHYIIGLDFSKEDAGCFVICKIEVDMSGTIDITDQLTISNGTLHIDAMNLIGSFKAKHYLTTKNIKTYNP